MFVTIRRYSPKNGAITKASMELLRRQIHDEFLPIVQQIQGFRSYYVLNVNDREVLTLSLCDSREGAAECSRWDADYTLRNPLVYELGQPEVTEGEVLTFAEGCKAGDQLSPHDDQAAAAAIALWLEESRSTLLTASER